MVEYWSPHPERDFEKPSTVFEYKSDTSLFEFKKSKSVPTSLTMSPTCEAFATFSHPDRQVRVFDFPSAKLHRKYDESIDTLTTMQQASSSQNKLPDLEFGRRIAIEADLATNSALSKANIIFDESGNFIIYGSLSGIKILNTVSNTIPRLLAHEETIRPLNLAIYQGAPRKKTLMTVEMAASANPLLTESSERDPMIITTAYQKSRFYIFSNDSNASKSDRDVLNEKPIATAANADPTGPTRAKETGQAAVIHTSLGDIHVRLFPEAAPKTVENFVTHSRNQYYNGTIFHRVIRKFMIQGGDPLGDGTGGESIWGGEFEDEFSTLKHDKPYTLSMANAGPSSPPPKFLLYYFRC
jgi:peptidylprolyl isomerase domain and WD repeat-containing protein 1